MTDVFTNNSSVWWSEVDKQKIVKAANLTNIEFKTRFSKLSEEQKMKNPPSCGRYFPGFLVVRNLGRKNQYETWMPEMVFEELYKKIE